MFTSFKPRPYISRARVKVWTGPMPTPRAPVLRVVPRPREVVSLPKENVLQHLGYMNLVRAMACIRCGKPPRSEFCHADEGKGTGIKTDCRRGWPGCRTCHTVIGSSGYYPKAVRRAFEEQAAERVRARILAEGAWPKRLPRWS